MLKVTQNLARSARFGLTRNARVGTQLRNQRWLSTEEKRHSSETIHRGTELSRQFSGFDNGEPIRTSLNFKVPHKPGALEDVLRIFWKHDLNLTRIESRPSKFDSSKFEFFIDFEGHPEDPSVVKVLTNLEATCQDIQVSDPKAVPWFPRHIRDLDSFSQKTLDAGEELESDHPGFSDTVYRTRRENIVKNASTYKYGMEIPRVDYNEDEIRTWGAVYRKLKGLFADYACTEYNQILPLLEHNCGYGEDNIPQLEDVSRFLQSCTGFQLRPVSGLLSARDFLNALAFRTFFSTQYIRHHSRPLYTPEPDVIHELMGHAPLLANPDFAELSQQYGLASLGASDRDIERLATCYWFTIEFGLCKENGDVKAFGAGLLSSFGEMEYACCPEKSNEPVPPTYLPWDPAVAAETAYPITTYQPTYFVAESLKDAGDKLKMFSEEHIVRPFHVSYLPMSQTIHCDRSVKRTSYPVE
uniref:phenylalanine 4-monooxygenase n=1 Tax=Mucochytrium quahogii TaxID=96639 RepID=A0A7S2SPC8_9STRA|mmetsp:Transcript_9481/g.20554  ORF Transcript_9481/g.20554 Transcript_9481/m.20554 type:complete len:470 (+) Transcript_9481:89-1498(+)